jgi:CO/xanthine dehydrogenase FAD-binding subunit
MLNMRIAAPTHLVDINRIDALNHLTVEGDILRIGALVRHADVLRSNEIREGWPLLAEATAQVAHIAIRNRGTVCGSISHNDPAAEHPSVLATYDGTVVIASTEGTREVPAEEFSAGMMSTILEPGEMVIEVRYPRPAPGAGQAFVEYARRLGDFAIAGAATILEVRNGICERARLTIVGMGDGPFRAEGAEKLLTGKPMEASTNARLFEEVAAQVMDEVDPAEDVHASSGYRRHLAGVLTKRALATAFARTGSM